MSFSEILEDFKNHKYIRRESWAENMFIQLSPSNSTIQSIQFEDIPNNLKSFTVIANEALGIKPKSIFIIDTDIRLTADDILANDWII